MIYLEMTPATSNIRAYVQPSGYKKRLPYQAIVTVTHLTENFVYLHCGVGKVDRETWKKTLDLLRTRGINKVQIERHGKMRVIDL